MSILPSHPWLLIVASALACAHHTEAPTEVEPSEESAGLVNSETLLAGLEEILETEGPQLDPSNRQSWPPANWTHARAYTYNFVRYGPGHQLRVFDDSGWSDDITDTFALNSKQAELAVELIHRSQGDVRASKCAFPRHAVVLFNSEDQPVASMNICFECSDILVWPPYFEDQTLQDSRYVLTEVKGEDGDLVEMPLIFAVHAQVLSSWERFFDQAGIEQFTHP
jgi:hypothetical protein